MTEFKNDVAALLSILADRVEVIGDIRRGSVVVDFRVLRDSASGDQVTPEELTSAFQTNVTVAGATVRTSSSSTPLQHWIVDPHAINC